MTHKVSLNDELAKRKILHKLPRHRIFRVGVVVEALPRLAAIPAGQHQALQQRRRGEAALLELVVHDVRDVVRGVEADEVEQRERPHGVAAAQLHRLVDVGDGAHALFIGANGVEQVGHQQAVDDESWLVNRAHRDFAQLGAEGNGGGEDLGRGGDGADDFDQLHHRDGIEEVQADEALGALGRRHELGHADGGSVGGEDGVFLDDGVELRVGFALFGHVLDDGLDDDVAVGEVVHAGGAFQPRLRRRSLFCGDAAFVNAAFHQPRKRLLDAGETLIDEFLFLLQHDDIESRRGCNLRDAGAHQTTTEYANFFDFHEDPHHYHLAPSGLKSARRVKRRQAERGPKGPLYLTAANSPR